MKVIQSLQPLRQNTRENARVNNYLFPPYQGL